MKKNKRLLFTITGLSAMFCQGALSQQAPLSEDEILFDATPEISELPIQKEEKQPEANKADEQISLEVSPVESPVSPSNEGAPSQSLDDIVIIGEEPLSEMTPETEKLFNVPGTAGDPITALQVLPGVVSNSRVKAAPAVRGSSAEDNHYLVDDLPVPYLFHLLGYSVFSESVVRDFDLQTGAFPSQYGFGTGAALHVSLRQPKSQPIQTTIDLGMFKSGIFLEGSFVEGQSFYFNYRKSTLGSVVQGVLALTDKTEEEKELLKGIPKSDDFYGKYNWQINEDNNLDFHINGASDGYKFETIATEEELRESPELAQEILKSQPKYLSTGVTWRSEIPQGGKLTSSFGNVYYTSSKNLVGFYEDELNTNTFLGKSKYDWSFNTEHQFKVGAEIKHERIDYYRRFLEVDDAGESDFEFICILALSCGEQSAKQNINTVTAFFEDNWFINDQYSLTSGLHASYDNYLNEAVLQPRLRLDYEDYNGLNVFAAFGQHSQYPKFEQVLEEFGSPDLEHQKANHFVVGANQSFFTGWNINSELYYKHIYDIVINVNAENNPDIETALEFLSLVGLDFLPVGQYENSGTGKAYGIEFLIEKEKINKFTGWLALSLSHSERTNNYTGETYDFKLDKPIVLDLVSSYDLNDRWQISGRFNLQSGRLYTPITDSEYNEDDEIYTPISGKRNSKRAEFEHSLDLRIEYTKKKPESEFVFYFDIFNIYNHKKTIGYEYNSDYSEVTEIEGPIGILPLLGMKYSF